MDADTETFDKYACAALTGLLANPACIEKESHLGVMNDKLRHSAPAEDSNNTKNV